MKSSTQRYRQTHREARWAILLSLGYFAWWYVSSYGFAPPVGETAMPELYFGMPLWFLLSCIIGPIVFCVACVLMVKYIYRDISLEPDENATDE